MELTKLTKSSITLRLQRIAVTIIVGSLTVCSQAQSTLWREPAPQVAAHGRPDAAAREVRDLHILFTDYLLGYYRVPETQSDDWMQSCPEPIRTDLSLPSSQLLNEIESKRSDGT